MQDRFYHQVAAVVIAILIAIVAIIGSYRPMRKAQMFITTLQGLQSSPATSLDDLKSRISKPLDYWAPIGQEEIVRNMANSVLAFVQQSGDPSSTEALIGFLHGYYDPILDRGKGMSFGQDVYLMGAINEMAFVQTGQSNYLQEAEKYYRLGHDLGPNRPQPLYGLFDIYRAAGDATDTQTIANAILKNWPSDTRIKDGLTQFLNSLGGATTTK